MSLFSPQGGASTIRVTQAVQREVTQAVPQDFALQAQQHFRQAARLLLDICMKTVHADDILPEDGGRSSARSCRQQGAAADTDALFIF